MAAAHHSDRRAVGQACGSRRVTAFAFAGKEIAAQRLAGQSLIAIEHRALRGQNFQKSFEHLLRCRMIVIILAQVEPSAGIEVQQSLDCFDVLDRVVVQLAAQLQKQKRRRENPGQRRRTLASTKTYQSVRRVRTWWTPKIGRTIFSSLSCL